MKINIAKSAGFCFGVKRAVDIALKTASLEKKVYMLSDIVHNEDIVKKIRKAKIKKIKKLQKGKNKTLLIQAHGMAYNILQKAKEYGYKIVDATCPMVKEIHKIAKNMEEKGYSIIIIGDKHHDEVKGIIGQLKQKPLIIENSKNISIEKIKGFKKIAVVVQSTQNIDNVIAIVNILKKHIKNLKFFNTICSPTRAKQEEIKKLSVENDIIIIIGSKKSANTKRLYEISKSLNQNTYWINSKKQIQKKWLKGIKSIGISAGASTPDTKIKEILLYIKKLN